MEFKKSSVLCSIALFLLPCIRAGCKEDIMQNSGFRECMMEFTKLLQNAQNPDDTKAMFEVLCSANGKAIIRCVIGYMHKECSDMTRLNIIPEFDIIAYMEEGGIDGFCAMVVGPCSDILNCIQPQKDGIMKREAPVSVNYYVLFHMHSIQMCGEMKNQMTCVLDVLDHCPASVVDQVEMEFEKAINMSTSDTYGVVSFKDTKNFIENECPKLPENFAQDNCTKEALVSQGFTACNEEVSRKYSNKRNCEVHQMSRQCLMDTVEPKCGQETAMFFVRNTEMIFPGIPDDCEGITAGSDVQRMPFGILLISTLLLLFLYL